MSQHPMFSAWENRARASKPRLTWEDNRILLSVIGYSLDDPRLAGIDPPDEVITLEDLLSASREDDDA